MGVTEVVVWAFERAEWARKAERKFAKNGRLPDGRVGIAAAGLISRRESTSSCLESAVAVGLRKESRESRQDFLQVGRIRGWGLSLADACNRLTLNGQTQLPCLMSSFYAGRSKPAAGRCGGKCKCKGKGKGAIAFCLGFQLLGWVHATL